MMKLGSFSIILFRLLQFPCSGGQNLSNSRVDETLEDNRTDRMHSTKFMHTEGKIYFI
jgi:hypothetical protein